MASIKCIFRYPCCQMCCRRGRHALFFLDTQVSALSFDKPGSLLESLCLNVWVTLTNILGDCALKKSVHVKKSA